MIEFTNSDGEICGTTAQWLKSMCPRVEFRVPFPVYTLFLVKSPSRPTKRHHHHHTTHNTAHQRHTHRVGIQSKKAARRHIDIHIASHTTHTSSNHPAALLALCRFVQRTLSAQISFKQFLPALPKGARVLVGYNTHQNKDSLPH
jgi:hypothetical protein